MPCGRAPEQIQAEPRTLPRSAASPANSKLVGIELNCSTGGNLSDGLVSHFGQGVPHFGALHGKAQNGGYVQAWDVKSKQMLWDRVVYRIRYDPKLEKDVQDVFIAEIQVRGELLLVKDERSEVFEMDLSSGRVRALTALGPNTTLPADAER
jgi:hypothetical protein